MYNVSCLSEISTTRDVSVAICLTIYNGEHQYNSNMIHAKKKKKKKAYGHPDVPCATGAIYFSGALEFIPGFRGSRGIQSSVLGVEFCGSLFVFCPCFILAIALSVLRFTSSDYSFGIFKPLFSCTMR
jgi:hypothetical protein